MSGPTSRAGLQRAAIVGYLRANGESFGLTILADVPSLTHGATYRRLRELQRAGIVEAAPRLIGGIPRVLYRLTDGGS